MSALVHIVGHRSAERFDAGAGTSRTLAGYMTDILLFGASGHTGRLTARALADRGASFGVAGRDPPALADVAHATGAQDVRRADATDLGSLVRALRGVRVLISCAGPFVDMGRAAAEAALRAGVHYLDSSGEPAWVARLLGLDAAARNQGIAMAPAMGWDEVPGDIAATLALSPPNGSREPMESADLTITYALPSQASTGTLRSAVRIIGAPGVWMRAGRPIRIRAGQTHRWAPMPPPLGVRSSLAWPLAEAHLAPLHLPLASLRTFVTAGPPVGTGMRILRPALPLLAAPRRADAVAALLRRSVVAPSGPDGGRWTILAEGGSPQGHKNVVMMGRDPYGLTAGMLATGARAMAQPGFGVTGVVAPVQAVGLGKLQAELVRMGVVTHIQERPGHEAATRAEGEGRT
ncbi:MAG: saccharopine dehydrogenase NADP-binding domain-containing protein [Actinomycetota bacterium]|nr:saccharopine dehydrogenase NADP-binding domain-containing protein [Actinomycetota bacterium]